MLPCVLYEDEHLLVVNKPAGINTHAPAPWAGEGIYDWLREREPRWAKLSIIHRLDKHTSGVLVFGLSPKANRSLSDQFEGRRVRKIYLLFTDRTGPIPSRCKSAIIRAGEKYVSRPCHSGAVLAETEFEEMTSEGTAWPIDWRDMLPSGARLVQARPLTGRTHQIRMHAAEAGVPVLGDTLYGGTPAERVFLHAWQLELAHPVSGAPLVFKADWSPGLPALQLRRAVIDPEETNAYRVIHGQEDGFSRVYVDKLGEFLLAQTEKEIDADQRARIEKLAGRLDVSGVYHKALVRHTRGVGQEASPKLVFGQEAPERFVVLENGLRFELSFREGYSVGLFLDQRENRRRLMQGRAGREFPLRKEPEAPVEILNAFAYTCGFSVAAARAGMRTVSLDLSKKYLEWGRRNFELNGIDPSGHDFIYGDVFDWLGRFGRRHRKFDLIILDPPTFSQSREHGLFRAPKDFGNLVAAAAPLLKGDGVLLAASNAAQWAPEFFLEAIRGGFQTAGVEMKAVHYVPQPPDFPVSRLEPAYLKTAWCRAA